MYYRGAQKENKGKTKGNNEDKGNTCITSVSWKRETKRKTKGEHKENEKGNIMYYRGNKRNTKRKT